MIFLKNKKNTKEKRLINDFVFIVKKMDIFYILLKLLFSRENKMSELFIEYIKYKMSFCSCILGWEKRT